MSLPVRVVFLICLAGVGSVYGSPTASDLPVSTREAKSLWFDLFNPLFGLGCQGCPGHFCETDPGIVLGYCCGCRRRPHCLPVICSAAVVCPLDIRGVCKDYEYMLRCCCPH